MDARPGRPALHAHPASIPATAHSAAWKERLLPSSQHLADGWRHQKMKHLSREPQQVPGGASEATRPTDNAPGRGLEPPTVPASEPTPSKEGSLQKTRLKAGGPEPPPKLSQPPGAPRTYCPPLCPCRPTALRPQAEEPGWRGLGHSHVLTRDVSVAQPASGCLCSAPDQHVAQTGTQGTGRRRTLAGAHPRGAGSCQPKASRLHSAASRPLAARSSCQGGPAGWSAPIPGCPGQGTTGDWPLGGRPLPALRACAARLDSTVCDRARALSGVDPTPTPSRAGGSSFRAESGAFRLLPASVRTCPAPSDPDT